MTTKFVGMKDFRQNMSRYTKEANNQKIKFIVLKKNTPVLEISPIDEKEYAYTKIVKELEESKQQIQNGEFATQEEIMHEFGIS